MLFARLYLRKYTQDFTMCYYIVNKNNTDWCKAPEQEKNMYKVWFDFVNDDGYVVKAFLDNNGQGFSFNDAEDLAHELKVRGHKNIIIELL